MTRFLIRTVRYVVKFCKRIRHNGEDVEGLCEIENKIIRIQRDLRGKKLVKVVAEEVIHASCWDLDEVCVQEMAIAIAEALYHPDVQERLE